MLSAVRQNHDHQPASHTFGKPCAWITAEISNVSATLAWIATPPQMERERNARNPRNIPLLGSGVYPLLHSSKYL